MHLDEERLQRLVHGELAGEADRSARAHLAVCDECRRRVAEAEREEREVEALLGHLDHPVPAVAAEDVAARARRAGEGWARLRWAAGFLLVAALGSAAYAVPGSPLRAWVRSVVEWAAEGRGAGARPSPPPEPGMAGISVAPGEALRIHFTSHQDSGSARVSLTDGAAVVVRAPAGSARFTSAGDRLLIENRGGSASFVVEVPRSAPEVEILLEGERIFLKQGSRVTAEAEPAPDGAYWLPLRSAAP